MPIKKKGCSKGQPFSLTRFLFLAGGAVDLEADQGNELFEGRDAFMEFLVFDQDIVVLAFDEGDGFFGVVELAEPAQVTERNKRGYAPTGDETRYDGEIFDHDA
jgi:hypothetical protein